MTERVRKLCRAAVLGARARHPAFAPGSPLAVLDALESMAEYATRLEDALGGVVETPFPRDPAPLDVEGSEDLAGMDERERRWELSQRLAGRDVT